jgi:hypothetical protein
VFGAPRSRYANHIIHGYDAVGLRLRGRRAKPISLAYPVARIIASKKLTAKSNRTIPDDVVAGNRHTPAAGSPSWGIVRTRGSAIVSGVDARKSCSIRNSTKTGILLELVTMAVGSATLALGTDPRGLISERFPA